MLCRKKGKIAFQCDECNDTTTEFVDKLDELIRKIQKEGWEIKGLAGGYYYNKCPDCIAGLPVLSRGVKTKQQVKTAQGLRSRLTGRSEEAIKQLQEDVKKEVAGMLSTIYLEETGLHYNTVKNFINGTSTPTKSTVRKLEKFLKSREIDKNK